MWAPNRRSSGMTLLELLVVIAMMALLAGFFPLAIERMIPARRLTATAQALAVHLRDLQSQAAFAGRQLSLTLDSSGYSLQQGSTDRGLQIQFPKDFAVTLMTGDDSQPGHTLVMYPDGSSSGGEFDLRVAERLATVSVSRVTGRVHVSQ